MAYIAKEEYKREGDVWGPFFGDRFMRTEASFGWRAIV